MTLYHSQTYDSCVMNSCVPNTPFKLFPVFFLSSVLLLHTTSYSCVFFLFLRFLFLRCKQALKQDVASCFLERLRREDIASENITNEICKLRVNLNYKQNNSSLVPHVFFFSSSIFIENLPHVFFYVLSNLHTSLFFPFF